MMTEPAGSDGRRNVTRPQAEPLHLSPVGWEAEPAELRQRQALARELGGKYRIARQHASGWRRPRGQIEVRFERLVGVVDESNRNQ